MKESNQSIPPTSNDPVAPSESNILSGRGDAALHSSVSRVLVSLVRTTCVEMLLFEVVDYQGRGIV